MEEEAPPDAWRRSRTWNNMMEVKEPETVQHSFVCQGKSNVQIQQQTFPQSCLNCYKTARQQSEY